MTSKSAASVLPELKRAAEAIKHAEALVITAGAGMGVDSGLPDYRGPEGFWRAFPLLKAKGLDLHNTNTPVLFDTDPEFAWGFFGHQYNLYSSTAPHSGFQILKKWAASMEKGYFVFTSNIDGHFQKAGFSEDSIVECHGSINFMQCVDRSASNEIWPVPKGTVFDVDKSTLKVRSPMPKGPPSEAINLARPNILMFDDRLWVSDRTEEQQERYNAFLQLESKTPLVVVEIGAGLAVPTVRYTSEGLFYRGQHRGTLIRINPNEPEVPDGHVSLPMKGLEALEEIDKLLEKR
jgi:NAD-dependent SIR2 family protein deacetylase